jgi:hypothetical protein
MVPPAQNYLQRVAHHLAHPPLERHHAGTRRSSCCGALVVVFCYEIGIKMVDYDVIFSVV